MKIIFNIITFAAVVALFAACTKESTIGIPKSGDFFPLQTGNYWEMEHTPKIIVTGTREIDNKTYSEVVQATDTTYYRYESGKIFARHLTEAESVKFDLAAKVNDTWTYKSGAEWTVKLVSKTDTLLINHTKVPNCYQFFFDIPMGADDENTMWLAPGIGFIRRDCGFCPYPFLNLEKANINNQIITFP